MKRPRPMTSQEKFTWKEPKLEEQDDEALYNNAKMVTHEPKLEIPDDDDDYTNANAMLNKVVKEENVNFSVKKEPIKDPMMEFSAKEEIMDDEEYTFEYQVPKSEPEPSWNMEMEMKPEIRPKVQQPPLMWKPKISSLTELGFLDDIDEDFDMDLGGSMLFDQKNQATTSSNFFDDDELDEGRKQLPQHKIRILLSEHFEHNAHPNAMEMFEIAQQMGIRYRTVFEKFEYLRKSRKVKCAKNDACFKIRDFFARESEPSTYIKVDEETRRILNDEIQTHLLSRKRFSIGYLHAIMEKLGTRTILTPAFIRGQYESWKKKMLTKDKDDYLPLERIPEDQPSLFSIDVLRKLEEAYLTKKYESEETEWSPKEIKTLAHHLDLDVKDVSRWIEKRRGAVLGFGHDVIQLRRDREAKMNAQKAIKKLPANKMAALVASFENDPRPNRFRRVMLANKLGLTEDQVRNFFNKRRFHIKKQREWLHAKETILKLPRESIIAIDRMATGKRKSPEDTQEIAKKMGIPYGVLCDFIDYKKSRTIAINDIIE